MKRRVMLCGESVCSGLNESELARGVFVMKAMPGGCVEAGMIQGGEMEKDKTPRCEHALSVPPRRDCGIAPRRAAQNTASLTSLYVSAIFVLRTS